MMLSRPRAPAAHPLLAAVVAMTAVALGACGELGRGGTEWAAGDLQLTVDKRGAVTRLIDSASGQDYAADGVDSPLLSVHVAGTLHPPTAFEWEPAEGVATLRYPGDVAATVRVTEKPTHLALELESVEPADAVELVVWGPFATIISETIGETVGVVRDSSFAIGIQALNPKTLGGLPWRDNDFPPQVDLFESGDYSDLSGEKSRYVLYRVEAAKPEEFGSTLQAYTRDRGQDRVIENWRHPRYVAPAYEDGGVIGSRIALFGSPEGDALATLGAIELEEGLPHPTIDGEWGKTARSASAAYLILDFGEEDVEQAIRWTQRAGLRYLYHPGPFRTWGHFELNDRFPSGRAGLKRAVETAEAAGIMVGVHTLSNFITTNDRYVTPVPDPRLARVGSSTLAAEIDASQTEIPVESPEFFAQFENNNLRTVVIGDELIQYRTVSEEAPWRLLDAERGAFETRAGSHAAGEEVGLLADHAYNVFLTSAELGEEMARNLADLYNETGLRQISFDGVEGNQSTGMGNYGEILFTKTWYDNLSDEIRRHLITDASRTSHYFWHIYTRMNWGEPWYAGFRESQTEYRLKNQPYFQRNLMPGMLGWFRMTPETTIEDVRWMLARSAAFNAGYSFVTSYEALEHNGFTDEILSAIGRWEQARMANVFTVDQRSRMEDVAAEFELLGSGPDDWELVQVYPQIFRHERGARQPGEPLHSAFEFDNPGAEQTLEWIVSAEDGTVRDIEITIEGGPSVLMLVTLAEGWSVRYTGGESATVRDAENKTVREIATPEAAFQISPGRHSVRVNAGLDPEDEAKARLELRPRGAAEALEE